MSHGTFSHLSPEVPTTLAERRQVALAVAAESDRLLRNDFGATSVQMFGSLAGQSPWHWDSDVDLAVSGLSFDDWWRAIDAVQAIAPPWLKVDLLRLETLPAAVRHRVLQLDSMPQNRFLNLKVHLEDEILALENDITELEQTLTRVSDFPINFSIRALATYINDFYRRCERMSERVAVAMDGGIPRNENWHPALLTQVAQPGEGDRPPCGVQPYSLS